MSNFQAEIKHRYLVVPINMNAKCKKICFWEDGKLVWDFDAHVDFLTPHFYTYVNIKHLIGRTLTLTSLPETDICFNFADSIPEKGYYGEELRPFVHFSAKIGWINDPNGLVYSNGVYHMFFQHNPADSSWGNMTWGHAVSRDLVHWRELESALLPDADGTMFSGSGIVDENNVSGLKSGEYDPILFYYTTAGGNSAISSKKPFTQCLAYSPDGGKSFVKYSKNPIISHIEGGNRDPKVIWCAELSRYILALYLDRSDYKLFSSKDLIHFEPFQTIRLKGESECPDIYPLEVKNESGVRKWVMSGASDRYIVGDFKDGVFTPVQEVEQYFYGHRTSYASQTFSNTGKRRVRVAWNVLHAPDMVFENQMGIPTEAKLFKISNLYRLSTTPVKEFEGLRISSAIYSTGDTNNFKIPLDKSAYDIEITAPESCPDFCISFFGYDFFVKPSDNTFSYSDIKLPLSYTGGEIDIRIISDVLGCEIYINRGLIYTLAPGTADYGLKYLNIKPLRDSEAPSVNLRVHKLKGIWENEQNTERQ